MAKKSMINRETKRARMVAKFASRRADLKKKSRDLSLTPQERFEAFMQSWNGEPAELQAEVDRIEQQLTEE